jgi:hypothetical protein
MRTAIGVGVDDSSSLRWGLDVQELEYAERPHEPKRSIRVRGVLPAWGDAFKVRIEELAALPSVGPDATWPMNARDVIDAFNFLVRVMREDTVMPWIGRLSSGGVQLTWQGENLEVEAVFDRARNEQSVFVVAGENECEVPADEAETVFATVVDRLSRDYLQDASTA